jgi:steroid 5-alpha reductase family enzyme
MTYFLGGEKTTRQTIMTALVCVWALRMGYYLLSRVLKRGKDDRFDEMRERPLAFLGFWVFQMSWVWICTLPLFFLNSTPDDDSKDIGVRDVLGWVIWLFGFALEVIADYTKDVFRSDPANSDDFPKTGVWAWSRHPNYMGESKSSVMALS